VGNQDRLKRDLEQQGEYDTRMAFYSLYRLREFARMGYTGFEGRLYSLFDRLEEDLRQAAEVQNLVTALAFKYIREGRVSHGSIPDDPSIESERRQIFFGAAIGIPTFFIREATENRFLRMIVSRCARTRSSHRYAGYLRVKQQEYRLALVDTLQRDGAELIERLGLGDTLADLRQRIEDPTGSSSAGRLTAAILRELNVRSPMDVPAAEFNRAAEQYYREGLRRQHLREAFETLEEEWAGPFAGVEPQGEDRSGAGGVEPQRAFAAAGTALLADCATLPELRTLIHATLGVIHRNARRAQSVILKESVRARPAASVC
jgi:hypothetical protein